MTTDPSAGAGGRASVQLGIGRRAHERLLGALDLLADAGGVDIAAPSRLPGWTRGHVLAHLVNSGEGHVLILEGAARGEVAAQYPHGLEGRAADIEAGAGRPFDEQLDALRRSSARLDELWTEAAASGWEGRGTLATGRVAPIHELPFLRAREVEIHHIDLNIGAEFEDLPADYLRAELREMEMLWAARQPMGMTQLPAAALAASPADRLAWLTGRRTIDGLGPADVI